MNTGAGCLDVVIVLRIPGLLCLDDVSVLSTVASSLIAIMLPLQMANFSSYLQKGNHRETEHS